VTAHSVLILGTDAVLAAAPATPVQLVHACQAAGYDAVIPASWGDELIAARAIERLHKVDGPVVQCSCPRVAERLSESAESIGQLLLCLVPPPVATAQYVRALFDPATPQITFVGACPSAANPSIDVWMSPQEFLTWLDARGIHCHEQPTEFDAVIPADRRRFFSEPGGVPSRHALRQSAGGIDLVELRDDDVIIDLAQQLLQKGRALIDIALPLDCVCSGRVAGVGADAARPRVREMEPPRALSPVVDHSQGLALDAPGPAALAARSPALASPPPARREFDVPVSTPEEPMEVIELSSRRRSPTSLPRPVLGTMPLARTDAGRPLPRAYVARRRSSPAGVRRIEPPSRPEEPALSATDERKRWAIVATAGVVVGLMVAWLIRLLP
jgi:hypothetical protein